MGGVRFDDNKEPWRAGGDNSKVGQKIIRYGPRLNSDINQIKMHLMSLHREKHARYKELLNAFNSSNDSKERIKILSNEIFSPPKSPKDCCLSRRMSSASTHGFVRTPSVISFHEIGRVYRDKKIGLIYKNKAPRYFSFSSDKLIINKLVEDGKYEEIASFFILSLTLEMQEASVENDLPDFSFSMSYNKDYEVSASLDAASL